jgi:SAM-dependent methyltransferase
MFFLFILPYQNSPRKNMNFCRYKNPYSLDTPESTLFNREIILNKKFLNRLYTEWYRQLIQQAKNCNSGIFLEIGSGGGFLKNIFPEVITSDILDLPLVDVICSAEQLPFEDNSLSCIMMLNVFHHIPKPYLFLEEAQRCLVMGGKILMIEPANSCWSRFIYKHFHHEPFAPDANREIIPGNPVSNSNQALPYIYFERDIKYFNEQFQKLQLNETFYHTPFLYLVSGGLSRKAFLPSMMYGAVKFSERLLAPFNRQLGMFCTIEIEKVKN